MIVGFTINRIDARRNDRVVIEKPEINVNTTPTITAIELTDVLGKKDTARFFYTFKCEYTPDLGSINFEGEVLWKGNDEREAERVANLWKKDNIVDTDAAAEALNAIFRRCLSRAIGIADELRLPPPVQFPIVKAEKAGGEKK